MADGSLPGQIIVASRAKTKPLLVADLFCGAGGMSNGAARAVRDLGLTMKLVGVNHWPVAIETNRRNHPEHAERIACANLETALPLDHVPEGYLDLLIAAPSCVFHSRARGGRPVHDQQRMDPWHVVRWCTELRVKRLEVENVPEFMDWGPCSLVTGRPIKSRRGEYFRAWIAALQAVGFRLEWRVLCCADYGDPTTRRRFFLIGRSDRGPLEWPEATHARTAVTDLLGTRQKWRGAREVIDWTKSGASIFTRPKPLKPNTVRRILAGAVRYRWPQPYVDALQALLDGRAPRLVFSRTEAVEMGLAAQDGSGLVLATGSGGAARDLDQPLPTITTGGAGGARPGCARPQLVEPLLVMRTNSDGGRTSRPIDEPLPTICTAGGGFLADPLIVPVSNSSSAGVPRSAADPIRTVTTAKGGDQGVAVPLVAPYYGGGSGLTASSVAEPVPSVTTKARFGLVEPVLMRAGHGDSDGRDPASRVLDVDAPVPALTTSNEVALAVPIVMRGNVGTGRTRDMRCADEPMPTITTSESLAFALPVTHHGDVRTHGMDEPLPTITGANRGELGLAQPFLVPNFGEAPGQAPRVHDIDQPVPTITASGHVQLAAPAAEVADQVRIDINYRMLHWRELARASSFDDEGEVYDFAGTATEITKQIGNAVPNRTAKALSMALLRDAAPAVGSVTRGAP
ncbi:DNA cytosine methyltransferase [Pseudoxanthomonas winnipegensis]|uniref:DNA cytosine methyltransferase n=1 Tax=Pseudoxanthomonas winnipegensis TaxID=2480810 RepID=UPI00102DB36C|nr:DNA cytosine methyltransferase [Pseudoxanthomonas winnipegensis]TAA12449.1 DNA methyltransferase [Pseudoxanthomonas winnipegensis]TAH70447.1 DNA methyltransferase [Pseudoxanthomonas winnipegensis]